MKNREAKENAERLSHAEFLLALSLRHLPEPEFWRVYEFLKQGWKLPTK